MPAWVGPDGHPLSWRHFQYGLAFARRQMSREQLAQHRAALMTKVKDQDRRLWQSDLEIAAGYKDR